MIAKPEQRDEIDELERRLSEVHAQMEAARQAYAERMNRLAADGFRLEMQLSEACVKAGVERETGRPSQSKHPLILAVKNLKGWAEREGLSLSTVKKWVYYGHSPSEEWQRKLLREYGVPLSTWARHVQTRSPKIRKRKGKG